MEAFSADDPKSESAGASFLPMSGFDAGFILPMNAPPELCFIHLHREIESVLNGLGFTSFRQQEGQLANFVVPVRNSPQSHSYYADFAPQFTTNAAYDDVDWRKWKSDRDWDPSSVDWSSGKYISDVKLLAFAWSDKRLYLDRDDLKKFLLENAGLQRFSAYMLVAMAMRAKREEDPLFGFLLGFGILEVFSHRPSLISYLKLLDFNLGEDETSTESTALQPLLSDEVSEMSEVLRTFQSYLDQSGVLASKEQNQAWNEAIVAILS